MFLLLKQSLQKKSHIPRRSPQKDEDFVHLTFLIFKLLSHNFLNDLWGDFQFSLKMTTLKIYKSVCQFYGTK